MSEPMACSEGFTKFMQDLGVSAIGIEVVGVEA